MADQAPSAQTPSTPEPGTPATPTASPPAEPAKPEGTTLLTGNPDPAKPATPDPAKPTEPAKPVVPEKYEFALDKSLGELNRPLVDAVTPLFREFGLSQEQASKLVTTVATEANKLNQAQEAQREKDFQNWMQERTKENLATVRKEWGADFDSNLKVAQRAIARFLSPEAKKLLDETGLGSHPAFATAFFAIGKLITEDTPPPNGSATGRKPLEHVLYPSMAGN